MTLWQHRARLIVAAIGIGCAIAVYAAMREREAPVAAPAPERTDTAALIESTGNIVQQVRGTKQDFIIKAERQLTYAGGATRLVNVEISVANRGGRDYVISAREAQAGERQQELQLRGGVRLQSSDGFELSTEEAFFSEADGQMRAPGEFAFNRRQLAGKGTGMTYDRTNDVLSVVSEAEIRLTDMGGNTVTQFLAGTAIFTRPTHLVVLGGTVHILHNDQIADAGRAAAQLNEDDSLLTRIELRENAEVNGSGQGVDRLRGQAIDLDYAADGQRLSQVRLEDEASVFASGTNGSPGQDIRGRTIDIVMSESGALSRLTADDRVQLAIEAQGSAPARTIEARHLQAEADAGGELTSARFDGTVLFRESAPGAGDRLVRSQALRVALQGGAVHAAEFSGAVEFDEGALQASGAAMAYDPDAGSLVISGADRGGGPRMNDEQIAVEAGRIVVQTASHDLMASTNVRTTLRPRPAASPARSTSAGRAGNAKLPGLFDQGRAATGTADALEYSGSGGQAVYTGNAALWQGDTIVRGDRVVIDRALGDLRVTGSARSTLNLASGRSESRSASLVYADGERTITYDGGGTAAALTGPDGDLRAGRIVVSLAQTGNRVETLTATTAVSLKLDARAVTGDRLTYTAADEQYVMRGAGRVPVKIVENCRETTGSTLTFYKSADRIVIDGNEAARTQSVRGQQCSEPARR